MRAILGALLLLTACSEEPQPEMEDEEQAEFSGPSLSDESIELESSAADLSFKGYECTEDCSGHEAGYRWAEEKGISDPNDCGGTSSSFVEGCEAYAEEQSSY